MAEENNPIKISTKVYPIAEPKNNTVAFASVTINDMIGINGIRIVSGEKGLFAAMPRMKDSEGKYRDICFPVTGELRKKLNEVILDEYSNQKSSVQDQIKEGAKTEKDTPVADKTEKNTPADTKGKNKKNKSGEEH